MLLAIAGCKKEEQPAPAPADTTTTQQQTQTPAAPAVEDQQVTDRQSAPQTAPPKPTLNDIVGHARTWGPILANWYGKEAPGFTLTDLAGKTHKLSDYKGKTVMLVFWAVWCRPCHIEIPHLIELRNRISKDKLAILGISEITPPVNTIEMIKGFVAQKSEINYHILPAETSSIPAPYSQIRGIPSSFFIDPDGRVKLVTEGLISLPEMMAIVQADPLDFEK